VVVNNLNLECIAFFPDETDSPLIVDPNTVMSSPVTLQLLQPVRWRNAQRIQAAGRRENFELSRSQALNVLGQSAGKPTTKDSLGFPTLEGFNHAARA